MNDKDDQPKTEDNSESATVNRPPEDPRDHPTYQNFQRQIREGRPKGNLTILEDARVYRGLLRFLEQTYSKYGNLSRIVDEDFGETLQSMRRKVRYLEGYEKAVDAGNDDIMLQITATVFYIVLAPSVPETAFDEVMRKAGRGEKLTVEIAEMIVARHKGNGGGGGGGSGGSGRNGSGKGSSSNLANANSKTIKSPEEFSKLRVDSQVKDLKEALWAVNANIKGAKPEALSRFRTWDEENPEAFEYVRQLLTPPETEAAEISAPNEGSDD